MSRLHSGFDIYIAPPDTPEAEVPLVFPAAIIAEDTYAKSIRVKTLDDKRRWAVAYTLTDTSTMERNGTAIRWTGTNADGQVVQLSGMSTRGGCIPCSRR